jgi:precorrin-2 dehydrogenase/sirohydrochlorin ferrochelatase
MPKPYFALNLDVVGKPCLVIGGDAEALEKSERLLEAQADLLVVAKRPLPELVEYLARFPNARLEVREVVPDDIRGKFFVLNCVKTDPELSKWIYEESLKHHAIISAYDQPAVSNAVMMGLVRAGRLRISIGSNGSSPGLVNAVTRALQAVFATPEFAAYSESVAEQRQCHIDKGASPKERKYRFKQQLKDFSISAKINYPPAYVKNLEQGVELRDGIWWRKEKKA